MAEIDPLTSGKVIIRTGKTAPPRLLPKKDGDSIEQLEVTVDPGVTTAYDLKSMLSGLNIGYVSLNDLTNIAGENKVFDKRELANLDYELEIRRASYELKKGGIDVQDGIKWDGIKWALSPETVSVPHYIETLIDLAKSGIDVDRSFIRQFTKEKAGDRHFIETLKNLVKSDIYVGYSVMENLTRKKARNPHYIETLKGLAVSDTDINRSITIDGPVIGALTEEKASDPHYIETLKDMAGSHILVDGILIWELTPEKASNPRYIETLKGLARSRIKVDGDLIKALLQGKARDAHYIEALKALAGSHISVDGALIRELTLEKASNPNYIETLKDLARSRIKVHETLIRELTLEKASNPRYIETLEELAMSQVKVDGYFIGSLTQEKAGDSRYIEILKELAMSQVKVDGYFIRNLTPEKAGNPHYIETLKALAGSHIPVDGYVIRALTQEKACDPRYIETLMDLPGSQIKVSGNLIESLTQEKARDAHYVEALKELACLDMQINSNTIQSLTLEKADSSRYIEVLKALAEAHIKITNSLIDDLTLEKANNHQYVGLLIANHNKDGIADFDIADIAYIKMISGIDIYEVKDSDACEILSDLYRQYCRDDLAEQILMDMLKRMLLPFVQRMNRLHSSSDAERLKVIEHLSAKHLFMLVICAREEIFTSTFKLVFDKLLQEMKNEKIDAYGLIKMADPLFGNYRQFLTTCSSYGRLKDFLATIPNTNIADRNDLLKRFVSELVVSNDMVRDSVSIAELMIYEKDPSILRTVEQFFLDAYNNANDPKVRKLYTIIGSMYYSEKNVAAFKRFADEYPLHAVTSIDRKELLNANNEIVEQQFYYNDNDGKDSFKHFKSMCENNSWKIQDKGSYIVVSKPSEKDSKISITIYANKPEYGEKGTNAILEEFKKQNLRSIIVVHRGHSYHVNETIRNIPDIARIVFLGGCGGFNNVSRVLERAPMASIITTKGMGTMTINDPLLMIIHETALHSDTLSWAKIWEKAEQKKIINLAAFHMYVRPDQNIAALIIKAYHQSTGD